MGGEFRVLSLDGGGFRGLLQAIVLDEMEKSSGRKSADCFDLIVGTSTGGILALALSVGIPASEIVSFYLDDGPGIFGSGFGKLKLKKLKWWFHSKHRADRLQGALKSRLGESILGEAQTRVVIPAFDIGLRKPYLFKTDHSKEYQTDWQRKLWEIGMATSAAPTYFSTFESSWGTHFCDGGLWANNPTHVGFIEATAVLRIPVNEVSILNLGNGCTTLGIGLPSWKKRFGVLGWAADMPELLMQGNAISVVQSCRLSLRDRLVRIEPNLAGKDCPLDEYKPDLLRSHAMETLRQNAGIIEPFFDNHQNGTFERCRRLRIA